MQVPGAGIQTYLSGGHHSTLYNPPCPTAHYWSYCPQLSAHLHPDFLPSLLSPSTVWRISLSTFLLCSTSCSLELTDRQALSPQALHSDLESSAQLGVMFTMTLALTRPFTPHPSPFFSFASSLPVPPGDRYGPLWTGSSHWSIIHYPWLV